MLALYMCNCLMVMFLNRSFWGSEFHILITLLKYERWNVTVLRLRGRNETTLVSKVDLVVLDGITSQYDHVFLIILE